MFIFAATWRTGSTLLQRILNASDEIFIWGEPTFLPDVLALFDKIEQRFTKVEFNRQEALAKRIGAWIPVVSPLPAQARHGLRALFDALYANDDVLCKGRRWGFKEVRPNAVEYIRFLKMLYPEARFYFLIRNPWDAYRSVQAKKFKQNFTYPMHPVEVWNQNACAAYDHIQSDDHCLLVKFEELIQQDRQNNELLQKITQHASINLCDRMYEELETVTDSSGKDVRLSDENSAEIQKIAGQTTRLFGYDPA